MILTFKQNLQFAKALNIESNFILKQSLIGILWHQTDNGNWGQATNECGAEILYLVSNSVPFCIEAPDALPPVTLFIKRPAMRESWLKGLYIHSRNICQVLLLCRRPSARCQGKPDSSETLTSWFPCTEGEIEMDKTNYNELSRSYVCH